MIDRAAKFAEQAHKGAHQNLPVGGCICFAIAVE